MFKICCSILLILGLTRTFAKAENEPERPLNCLAQVRCSNIENTIWATNGRRCFVLMNGCFLRNANCERLRRGQPILKEIPRAKCQTLCPDACTMQYVPVCGEYRGQRRQFGSSCHLNVHICHTGEIYQFLFRGECTQNEFV